MNKNNSLYTFSNYRAYLNHVYVSKKQTFKGFSFRNFSKRTGFSSPNFLKLVIDGKRSLSFRSITKISEGLKLSKREHQYFENLVLYNQAQTPEEKKRYYEKLSQLPKGYLRKKIAGNDLVYLKSWLVPVIREMAVFEHFKLDPYFILMRLNWDVEPQKIAEALQFLVRERYLISPINNSFTSLSEVLESPDEVANLDIRKYHESMMHLAIKSLDCVPLASREIGSLTFSLPSDHIILLKDKIKNFQDEILDWAQGLVDERKVDSVIQMNIQMFPHTKIV